MTNGKLLGSKRESRRHARTDRSVGASLTKTQKSWTNRALVLASVGFVAIAFGADRPVSAVPSFGQQTGQTCASCHVGGFGPELTTFGREFKLGGYTMRTKASVPLGVIASGSWTHTRKDQTEPPEHLSRNNNLVLDDAGIYIGGGIGSHFGGYAQVVYSGIERKTFLEMLDLRAVTPARIFGEDATLGLTVNNAPTIEDPWNTLAMWAPPYTDTEASEGPDAAPLIDMIMGNVIGVSAYSWIGGKAYLALGGYTSPSAGTLRFVGIEPEMIGSVRGVAPYGRVAWQTNLAGGTFHIGASAFKASIFPMRDRSAGLSDRYTDLGIDSSWLKNLGSDTLTVNLRYEHEKGNLRASCALGLVGDPGMIGGTIDTGCARYRLNQVRGTVGYSWHNKIGANLSAFSTTGSRNFNVYGGNGRPDSNGIMGQVDFTPWGDGNSPLGPRFNARVGAQYTIYGKFNGRRRNYDLDGANAADKNAFRIFTIVSF